MTSLASACLSVLEAADANIKARLAQQVAMDWAAGNLSFEFDAMVPDRPARPAKPVLLLPGDMPRRRKGGSEGNRIALMHAVAHIELNAIDLAFDIVGRFGSMMPRTFSDDWIAVGADEGRHFELIQQRLDDFGSSYGDLPAHDGLWESAVKTAHHLPARLAVVPMVLEARGLDVTPGMIDRLERFGDQQSADVLKVIYEEEVAHVAAGKRWFQWIAERNVRDLFFHSAHQVGNDGICNIGQG